MGLETTRSYSSYGGQLAPLKRSGGLGLGWSLTDEPYAMTVSAMRTAVFFSPTQSYWFTPDGDSFTPLYGAKEMLVADTTDHLLDLTMPDGSVYVFNDFSYTDARAGQLVAFFEADGSAEVVTATDADAANQISQIEWYDPATAVASDTPYQAESFTYYTAVQDPANAGRLVDRLGY